MYLLAIAQTGRIKPPIRDHRPTLGGAVGGAGAVALGEVGGPRRKGVNQPRHLPQSRKLGIASLVNLNEVHHAEPGRNRTLMFSGRAAASSAAGPCSSGYTAVTSSSTSIR